MLKKLIIIGSFLFAGNVLAGTCNEPVKLLSDLSLKELNILKSELKKSKEDTEFDYHYTLTHNRIYMKSSMIHLDNNIKRLTDLNKDNESMAIMFKEIKKINIDRFMMDLNKINAKSKEIYDFKNNIIDSRLSKVNKLIDKKVKKRDYK